jgi:hypothetical protein
MAAFLQLLVAAERDTARQRRRAPVRDVSAARRLVAQDRKPPATESVREEPAGKVSAPVPAKQPLIPRQIDLERVRRIRTT